MNEAAEIARSSAERSRSSERFNGLYEGLQKKFDGSPLPVSFRELAGPLPADEHTHGIYPYPARLVRHIPRMLLRTPAFVGESSHVFDPFCGSGTVLVEAQHAGLTSTGIDDNPMAVLMSRVKTTRLSSKSLIEAGQLVAHRAKSRRAQPAPRGLGRWYSNESASVLSRLVASVQELEASPIRDALCLAIALTSRRVNLADARIPVPVLDASKAGKSSHETWRHWNASLDGIARRVSKVPRSPQSLVASEDARSFALKNQDQTIVLSSPPYGAAQKYSRATWLEAAWLQLASSPAKIEQISVGREHLALGTELPKLSQFDSNLAWELERIVARDPTRGKIYAHYFTDMRETITSIVSNAVVKRVCFILGTNHVAGANLDTHVHIVRMANDLGLSTSLALVDEIKGRTLLTTRNRGATPARSEFVYVLDRI